ncbi:MAG: hypothetical protein IKD80_01655 [Selenomonadaceae bacterium]|nr:hypothetical protein [Selenomonadaceae bacterium]
MTVTKIFVGQSADVTACGRRNVMLAGKFVAGAETVAKDFLVNSRRRFQ